MFEDDEGFVNKFHKLFTHKYCDFNMIGCQFRNNIYDVLDDYTEGKYRVKKKGRWWANIIDSFIRVTHKAIYLILIFIIVIVSIKLNKRMGVDHAFVKICRGAERVSLF